LDKTDEVLEQVSGRPAKKKVSQVEASRPLLAIATDAGLTEDPTL
jgi:hypothetical protein